MFYYLKGFEVNTEKSEDFPGNTTFSGTITKLNGFTDYSFRVMAYTKVGGNLKSPPVTRKTFEGSKDDLFHFIQRILSISNLRGFFARSF